MQFVASDEKSRSDVARYFFPQGVRAARVEVAVCKDMAKGTYDEK